MKHWRQWLPEILIPLGALILAAIVGVVVILSIGKSPTEAFGALMKAAFGSTNGIAETLVGTTPLIFTGLSVALAFRCGLFNIGGEGQYLAGGLAAAVAGYSFTWLPGLPHAALAVLAGALAGAVWAGIPGLLKAYRGVHEVVNTIMMNYVALYMANYALLFLKKPGPVPTTPEVVPAARFGILLEGTRLHSGLLLALLCALLVWILLWRTTLGYSIRAVGFAPLAAEYGGTPVGSRIVYAMAFSGALSGLAGASQVVGVQWAFYDPIGGFIGYGFDGIAVALLGRNHPLGVIVAALLFGILDRGSGAMQAIAGVPKAVIWILQASVVFFIAADGLIRSLLRRREAA